MKKKKLVLLGIVALAMVMTAACGKSKPATGNESSAETETGPMDETDEETTVTGNESSAGAETEPVDEADNETAEILGWLDDSAKAFAAADMYEEKSDNISNYDDGSAESYPSSILYDSINQTAEKITDDYDGNESKVFYKKEGDVLYTYKADTVYAEDGSITSQVWFRYPVTDEDDLEDVQSDVMPDNFTFF